MKRFHVHVGVADLADSIRFYSSLFNVEPSVTKSDYAKWMLDDPRINFAISQRGDRHGVNHLGMQVDSDEELHTMHAQLAAADAGMTTETSANCCYAKSDKYWTTDPQGLAWETFHSLGTIPFFGAEREAAQDNASIEDLNARAEPGACCAPSARSDAVVTEASNEAVARCCV